MKQHIPTYLRYFLILVYVSGSIGFVVNPGFFSPFTPYTLLLTCLVYLLHQPLDDWKFTFSFLVIALIGYIIEVVGVQTGLVFGAYAYGAGLGHKFIEVPLIISFNWALLITSGVITASRFFTNKHVVLLVSAVLVTAIDLLIEQVAFKLDFWYFESGLPGWNNYIGWLVVSYISPYFVYAHIIKGNRSIALLMLLLQVLFFATLFLFL